MRGAAFPGVADGPDIPGGANHVALLVALRIPSPADCRIIRHSLITSMKYLDFLRAENVPHEAQKHTDKLACDAWNKRMLVFQGAGAALL